MTEQPRTFTAPTTGTYHVVSGQDPHLVQDCTEVCETTWQPGDPFVAEPGGYMTAEMNLVAGSTVGFENSGGAIEMPTTSTTIAFDSH